MIGGHTWGHLREASGGALGLLLTAAGLASKENMLLGFPKIHY